MSALSRGAVTEVIWDMFPTVGANTKMTAIERIVALARSEHEVKEEALRDAAEFFRGVDMPEAADLLENLADGWARPLRDESS